MLTQRWLIFPVEMLSGILNKQTKASAASSAQFLSFFMKCVASLHPECFSFLSLLNTEADGGCGGRHDGHERNSRASRSRRLPAVDGGEGDPGQGFAARPATRRGRLLQHAACAQSGPSQEQDQSEYELHTPMSISKMVNHTDLRG